MSRVFCSLIAVGCSAALSLSGSLAYGQAGYVPSTTNPATRPFFRAPGSYQRVSGRNNPALAFFGGSRALEYAPQGGAQRRVAPQPAALPVQTVAAQKPFTTVPQNPIVTPYLGLNQLETADGLPNFYMYVKPQLDQYAVNQVQQAQYRRVQQEIRRSNPGVITPAGASGGMPTTGHSTQFMNNGGYYPGMK
jgi:hypothetical protein